MNIVVMFPYPSGAGLHLGHYYNYAIVDSICRWYRYMGHEVFQPFGYDAFGLPAENYAKSIGGDPKDVTYSNIDNFRSQMKRMNTQYEERLITCDQSYIKWTQWIFTKLYERGLAYKANGIVNWCIGCQTVLANEQVINNKCERCSSQIEFKELNQWYFKITEYKDRLIKGLDSIDYPSGTIKQQRVWLSTLKDWCVSRQRKWGCPIPIPNETDTLDTFVDSSFYYLRYLTNSTVEFLPKNDYRPIDLYVGGAEHACMHLIYSRFIHYFLYDIGIVPQEEPFNKVIHQGMITYQGHKMSKSKGNAVNPDDYNSDELRMFLMFLGPYDMGGDWNPNGIKGITRFIGRLKRWLANSSDTGQDIDLTDIISFIDNSVKNFKINTIISELMKFYNTNCKTQISKQSCYEIVRLIQVFAPSFNTNG